jgi:hypothetical protein
MALKKSNLIPMAGGKPESRASLALVPAPKPLLLNGLTLHLMRTVRKDADDRVTPLKVVNGVVHAELTEAQLQFLSVHLEIAATMQDGWLDWHRESTQDLVPLMHRQVRDRKQREINNREADEMLALIEARLEATERELRRNPWGLR